MIRQVFLVALCAALAAGCSTNTARTVAADDDDKVVVTGSHIPRKDRSSAGVTSIETKDGINSVIRPSVGAGSSSN